MDGSGPRSMAAVILKIFGGMMNKVYVGIMWEMHARNQMQVSADV